MDDTALVRAAIEARSQAYVPYSRFSVGAALKCADGAVYCGCNIENAAYSPSCCAERTAIFRAIFDGRREFSAIAVVGGPADEPISRLCAPCGVCRQVMMEFCDPKTFRIVLAAQADAPQSHLLEELLQLGFGPLDLKG
ncbi:cytidine deaminase [Coriobacterium glomerans PW2]|uniref:Cytidine deaminase n=1 Tax=Coriobacterium glomerans (strain ATCC 49209 / DSM 20642 / JCM 10262 / PW2) TaxID=700015 RepID=F2NB97_CORGP|nr:cytidine deaminase [Coriobacterium glomerans PW2]